MAISRYFNINVIPPATDSGPSYYATWDYPKYLQGSRTIDLIGNDPFTVYTWEEGDRIDYVSHRFFNDSQYWWVIALVNGISFPLSIQPGTPLRIPNDVNTVLQKLNLY